MFVSVLCVYVCMGVWIEFIKRQTTLTYNSLFNSLQSNFFLHNIFVLLILLINKFFCLSFNSHFLFAVISLFCYIFCLFFKKFFFFNLWLCKDPLFVWLVRRDWLTKLFLIDKKKTLIRNRQFPSRFRKGKHLTQSGKEFDISCHDE